MLASTTLFVLLLASAEPFSSAVYEEGDLCDTLDFSVGECRRFRHCPSAIRTSPNLITTSFFRCGFAGIEEVVCCPERSPLIPNNLKRKRYIDRIIHSQDGRANYVKVPQLLPKVEEYPNVDLGYIIGDRFEFTCSGIILSELFIVSAAHCFVGKNTTAPSVVRTGSRPDTEAYFPIRSSIVHPFYTTQYKYHDVALIILDAAFHYSYSLRPACIYDNPKNYVQDERVVTSRWNVGSNDHAKSKPLKANMTVVSVQQCNGYLVDHHVGSSQICARGDQDFCDISRTIEGPMQVYNEDLKLYEIIGIWSYGDSCAVPKIKVYTRVSVYSDWIEETIAKHYGNTDLTS